LLVECKAGTLQNAARQSVCGVAQQVRMNPALSSSTDSALSWCAPWITRPSISRHLHEPHAPSLQP
jgi:hypothetical protein